MATSTSRSSGTKKSSTKKSSTRKTAAKNSSDGGNENGNTTRKSSGSSTKKASSRGQSAPRAEARPAARASQVAATAAGELLELTGKAVEGVTGLESTDDGWTVQVEVVEVRRIPDTTDVLALYEVSTDKQGSLLGYRRLRRYARGTPGDD
jgi:Gas vesicle synthesis protein GvpO